MEIQPYLFLDGRCEEAITFYCEFPTVRWRPTRG